MALRFETARSARPPAPPNCPAGGRLPTTRQPDRGKSESGARAFSMRPVPRSGRANPAAIAALLAERIRSQMAPQRLEKIESAPGNGMASETPDPQHLVQERHRRVAEPTRVSVARDECYTREGDGNFPGRKALKSHEMRKGSHPSRLMELRTREAGDEDSSASPRLRGNRRPRASDASPPRPERSSSRPAQGPGECGRRGRGGKLAWLQSLEKPQNGKITAPKPSHQNTDGDDGGSASPRLRRKSFSSAAACRRPPLLTRARSLVQKPACFASRTRDERGRTAGATG
jgi:hypothetical protein